MKLKDRIEIINRNRVVDSRGWFLKIITGKENALPPYTGEVYSIMALPGETRANHYHLHANEWFTLIIGKAIMELEDIDTMEKLSIELDAETPMTIFVPSRIAHRFMNSSNEEPYILLTYTDQLYKSEDTLPYSFENRKRI